MERRRTTRRVGSTRPDFRLFAPLSQLFNATAPAADDMEEPETSAANDAAKSAGGFHVSDEAVVRANRAAAARDESSSDGLPAFYGTDLLYVIARDPKSLFLYWDLNWTPLFAHAGLSSRQVHLRVYRADGSIEGTQEINPFRGHCYVDVAAAGTGYYCELGCFDGDAWISLVRSRTTATPEASMSEDLSADFATLPIHLSFQRLIDIFQATKVERTTLARSVAELQENAQALQDALNGGDATDTELGALLKTALRGDAPTADQLAQWKQLGKRFGGASWGGASGSGFGGSSPA
jgi:hypothetical protein